MLRLFGVLLLVSFLAIGCDTDDDESNEKQSVSDTETLMFDAGEIGVVSIGNINGTITISTTTDDSITSVVTRECKGYDVEGNEGMLDSIDVNHNDTSGNLSFIVDIPDEAGDYEYYAYFDLQVPATVGLNLSIINGEIELENHEASINAGATNGVIECDLAELAVDDSLNIGCTNGSITLTLPVDVSASFVASVVIGTVSVTGFPSVNYTLNEDERKTGTFGEGEASINLALVNGTIEIRNR